MELKKSRKKAEKPAKEKTKADESKADSDHKEKKENKKNLIAVIRIEGMVKVKPQIANTLFRLRLRRKYSCVLINQNDTKLMGMIKKVKYAVAYGEIEKEMLIKLLETRAKKVGGGMFNALEVAEGLMNGKKLSELGFKAFFRLHPPRRGIKSKLQYPKGVLGNNGKNINKLIERML